MVQHKDTNMRTRVYSTWITNPLSVRKLFVSFADLVAKLNIKFDNIEKMCLNNIRRYFQALKMMLSSLTIHNPLHPQTARPIQAFLKVYRYNVPNKHRYSNGGSFQVFTPYESTTVAFVAYTYSARKRDQRLIICNQS